MIEFELWLDESGDFENDEAKIHRGEPPSLIGGLLVEKGTFSDRAIDAIIPEGSTHSTTWSTEEKLKRFDRIEQKLHAGKNNRFVFFTNREGIMVIDNNLTYQNVIIEGILQLVKELMKKYGYDMRLTVVIANRVDTTTGKDKSDSVVPIEQYERRFKERLIMESLQLGIRNESCRLTKASARNDKRLMLADIVCNVFYTKNRSRFSDTERKHIEEKTADALTFTVFESAIKKQYDRILLDGRTGEAIAYICFYADNAMLRNAFRELKDAFAKRKYDFRTQHNFVSAYVEYYIRFNDFAAGNRLIDNLLHFYVPLLKSLNEQAAASYELDLKLYKATILTHMGDTDETETVIDECYVLAGKLPDSLEKIEKLIKLDNRRIIGKVNLFDFETALSDADRLVRRCEEIKELLAVATDSESVMYDEYGKALGTRVQIRTRLCKGKQDSYLPAVEDSDRAMNEFLDPADKARQFLYRAHLETECGHFDDALNWIKKAADVQENASVKTLAQQLGKDWKNRFIIEEYVRLMALSADSPSFSKTAEEMFNCVQNVPFTGPEDEMDHPVEIIFWKFASYYAKRSTQNAAIKNFDIAVSKCWNQTTGEAVTLKVIGVAVLFEKIGWLLKWKKEKEAKKARQELIEKWDNMVKEGHTEILNNAFGNVDLNRSDHEYYLNLAKRVVE